MSKIEARPENIKQLWGDIEGKCMDNLQARPVGNDVKKVGTPQTKMRN